MNRTFCKLALFVIQCVKELLFFKSPWTKVKSALLLTELLFYPINSKCGFKEKARRTGEARFTSLLTGFSTVSQLLMLVRLHIWHTYCCIFRSPANYTASCHPSIILQFFTRGFSSNNPIPSTGRLTMWWVRLALLIEPIIQPHYCQYVICADFITYPWSEGI